VIGLLTILGFSLYDTVVVFDKVKENTRGLLGLTRRTYGEAANLALNQTLMRSINTSLIALLPVIGLLVVGVGILGVGTLQDLALVQLVGMFVGALSSIFIATPVLVDLKMRDPKYIAQAKRVAARRAKASGPQVAEGIESTDDDALARDVRKEEAMAAAAAVPHRTAKASDARRRPTGKRQR
jgi:preprotein translocase subunit SecF